MASWKDETNVRSHETSNFVARAISVTRPFHHAQAEPASSAQDKLSCLAIISIANGRTATGISENGLLLLRLCDWYTANAPHIDERWNAGL